MLQKHDFWVEEHRGDLYQRCIQKCFEEQIGRNVHAYVDDVVIKSKKAETFIDDLKETFANLRRYKMKLNPTKCVFGVPAGMLLGYIVSQRGIEANPAKIKAIQGLKKPEELKDVQQLTGCIAALSRFISRLGEKAIPLYRLLKKSDKFVWDQEADDAFETLKKSLAEAPVTAADTSQMYL